jgi:hypothetical protein
MTTGKQAAEQTPAAPKAVRVAFALYMGEVVLAIAAAGIQVFSKVTGPLALIGAAIELLWFVGLGSQMRLGKARARTALMGVSWMFIAINVFGLVALNKAVMSRGPNGWLLFAVVCVALKVIMIGLAVVAMYRSTNHDYFE